MIAGMLRVKDEARWIGEVLQSILPLCEQVFILDDHSTDGTAELCRSFERVTVYDSPFEGIHESRDKNWLLEKLRASIGIASWVLAIDGDEVLTAESVPLLRELALRGSVLSAYSLQVLYLWNSSRLVRTDGVYHRFFRPSFFNLAGLPKLSFYDTGNGGGFHCGNVPYQLARTTCKGRLLHYGYLHQADRLRKFAWYNRIDPNNSGEDGYRHMVQGDPGGPDANLRLLHAGPLKLEPLCA